MDKISNYKRIVEALKEKRDSLDANSSYDGMLKRLNIIEISPINETTIKIFEDYAKIELNASNANYIIDKIKSYGQIKIYGDFFRRVMAGTIAYDNITKAARLFCNDDYNLDKNTNVINLIVTKQEELRIELSRDIKELICESRIDYRFDENTPLDSIQDTDIVLNTIAAIIGAATYSNLKFELKYILGREIDPNIYRFNMRDIKMICDYFDINYNEIEEVYNRVR